MKLLVSIVTYSGMFLLGACGTLMMEQVANNHPKSRVTQFLKSDTGGIIEITFVATLAYASANLISDYLFPNQPSADS